MTLHTNKFDRNFKAIILLSLLVVLLYFAGHIFFPIFFAAFVALGLSSIANRLDKFGLNRFVSAFLITLFLSLIFVAVILFLTIEGYQITSELNSMSGSKTMDMMGSLIENLRYKLGLSGPAMQEPINSISESILSSSGKIIRSLFSGVQSTVVFFSLVPIYIFFMLSYRTVFSKFLNRALKADNLADGQKVVEELIEMLRRYVNGLFIVIVIVAILNSVGLYFIGIGHPIFFGTATAILMVIPYIGVLIGSIVPAAIAFITLGSIWYPVAVLSLYTFVQFLEANYITPAIVGTSINLNPLAIIIGMVILGALGGVLAMIIAVPIIATIRILLNHSSDFSAFAILFEQEE